MGNYGPESYSYNPTTGNLASKTGMGHRRCPLQLLRPEWEYGAPRPDILADFTG
jgi:hypothetical protein